MSLEQAFMSAIGAVVTALCYLFTIYRAKSDACEKWRAEMEPLIRQMAQDLGLAEGVVTIVNACRVKGCPHAGKLTTSFSLSPKPPKEKP